MPQTEHTLRRNPGQSETSEPLCLAGIDSPVGRLLVGVTRRHVRLLEFAGDEAFDGRLADARQRFPLSLEPSECPLLERVREQLGEYFTGQRRAFELPLHYPGTAFQEKVWAGLLGIGYGHTASYLELARSIGAAGTAVRAVGQANGLNPIAILIPCHRVINADGSLGGFGGGPWRKQFLLDHERGDRLF